MGRPKRLAALLLVCLLAAPAWARPDSSFQKLYDQATDAFNLGEHDRSRELFTRAASLDPKKPGPQRWLGRLARIREDWEECVARSTAAIRLRPETPLLAEVKGDIDACRAALGRPGYERPLAAGQGALAVIANVEGAAVVVDKIAKGPTPVAPVPLNKGRHVVEVSRDGYAPSRLEIDVVPGIIVDAVVKLESARR